MIEPYDWRLLHWPISPRRKKTIGGYPVAHMLTCPACGRKSVNIYQRGAEWKCKRCWDKENGDEN